MPGQKPLCLALHALLQSSWCSPSGCAQLQPDCHITMIMKIMIMLMNSNYHRNSNDNNNENAVHMHKSFNRAAWPRPQCDVCDGTDTREEREGGGGGGGCGALRLLIMKDKTDQTSRALGKSHCPSHAKSQAYTCMCTDHMHAWLQHHRVNTAVSLCSEPHALLMCVWPQKHRVHMHMPTLGRRRRRRRCDSTRK